MIFQTWKSPSQGTEEPLSQVWNLQTPVVFFFETPWMKAEKRRGREVLYPFGSIERHENMVISFF